MADTGTKKSKYSGLEEEKEFREEMEQRDDVRRTNAQNEQQDLNQGMSTGTHSSAHSGIHWGASYRMKSKTEQEQALPTKEQIELRAYELYLERGGQDGQALEDWLMAENELKQDLSKAN
jgi:hypothetical protein